MLFTLLAWVWNPIKDIQLGPLTLHVYSLMFVLAFTLGYLLMTWMFDQDGIERKYLEPLVSWTVVGTIFGARIGHVVFYEPELFIQDFWSVFLPIQTVPEFRFTGFAGLASHGATIALILTTLYYSRKILKKNPFFIYDRLGIVVALAGGFIRIGNFFNSEIIGKPAGDATIGVIFPQASREYGAVVPRYPTQLMEATGYFLLFILLICLYRFTKKKYQQGWLFGLFFFLLWLIRFVVEFWKEPQGEEFIHFGGLNTGHILSIPFMLAGIFIMLYSKKFQTKEYDFIEKIQNKLKEISFDETIVYIDANYQFIPTAFRNGEVYNEKNQNNGSCKIFAFAQILNLSKEETLHLFGDFYRKDVLKHPENTDHQNIRNFIKSGWKGIHFEGKALTKNK